MKQSIFKCLLLGIALSVSFASCREDEFVGDNELGDGGKTIQKFPEGPSKTLLFEAFTNIKPVNGFSLIRDVNSNAGLSSSASIELVKAAVPAGYTFLPDNIFTLQTAAASKFTKTANGYSANFAPGDFSLDFNINLNGALLDPTAKYALAYTIGNSAGNTVTTSTQKTITVLFTILNAYDGMYSFQAGSQVTRYDAAGQGIPLGDALSGSLVGKPDRAFTTIDGNTVTFSPIWADGAGAGGIDNLRLYINPATNQTTMTALGNLTLRNIPGKPNFYDPVTKTFTLNFEWNQTATTKATRDYNLVLKYVGKRP